jgi:hypothetical protein
VLCRRRSPWGAFLWSFFLDVVPAKAAENMCGRF